MLRRRRGRLLHVAVLAAASVIATGLVAAPSRAQAPDSAAGATRRGDWELWGGIGGRSPQWGILGETPDMRFGLVALRWTRPIGAHAASDLPVLAWTVDLVPIARLSPPLVSLRGTGVPCDRAALCVLPPDRSAGDGLFPPDAPFGFGFSPIGLTRRFRRAGPISPWLGITGGALYFSERVPTTQAARFNFTASGELGLRFGSPSEPGLTVAYRFHHISNGGTAGENPGVASHLITVGLHHPRR